MLQDFVGIIFAHTQQFSINIYISIFNHNVVEIDNILRKLYPSW